MKEGEDLKYSYGRSLLTDFLFTGDTTLVPAIERIASAGEEWDPTYDMGTNFWTERHQAYALLAAVAAWEATGAVRHAARAARSPRTRSRWPSNPVESWHADGCMLHGMTAHEGAGGDVPNLLAVDERALRRRGLGVLHPDRRRPARSASWPRSATSSPTTACTRAARAST